MSSYPLLKDNTSGGGGGNFVPSSWTGSNASLFAGTSSYVSGSVFTGINPALTASYALTASTVLNPYPINVTGSTLYSVAPVAGVPNIPGANNSIFFGDGAGYNAPLAANSNFLGYQAGYNVTSVNNANFIGYYAGRNATTAINSNFIGNRAGLNATTAINSNFIGTTAGEEAPNTQQSNFIGYYAGYQATDASQSNFIGSNTGRSASNAAYSNFLGYSAGEYAANASHSILIGSKAGYNNLATANNSVGPNNIILGTNITLPPASKNSINIGGLIFATGSHSDFFAINPLSTPADGKVGINVYPPLYNFHVSGTVGFPDLTDSNTATKIVLLDNNGQLFTTASSAVGGGGSGVTINNNTNNYLVTATGTSNTLDGEANLTFDGSSLRVVGDVTASSFTGSFTGSLFGTASYADTASAVNVTVSSNTDGFLPVIVAYTGSSNGAKLAYIDSGFQYNPFTNALYLPTNGALVAGNVTISSNTSTFGSATSQNQTVRITGSLNVSKSINVDGVISASFGSNTVGFFGTASWAESASQALTASYVTILNQNLTISGNIIPAGPYVDNTSSYNLGSPTAAWDEIYVSNNSLYFVSGSVSASIGFNGGVINFNNATVNIPTGSIIPYTSTSSLIGDGVLSSFNINHGFNTRNLHITVYESGSNGETVYPDIRRINENTASIIFANPPTSNQYIVYISQ